MLTNETEAERYRKQMVEQAEHIEGLKREIAELTQASYATIAKMKEVCDERDNLKIQVENLKAQLNIQHYWDDTNTA